MQLWAVTCHQGSRKTALVCSCNVSWDVLTENEADGPVVPLRLPVDISDRRNPGLSSWHLHECARRVTKLSEIFGDAYLESEIGVEL